MNWYQKEVNKRAVRRARRIERGRASRANQSAAETISQQAIRIEELENMLRMVDALVGNSQGVDGLHLNGESASWESLKTGGFYEGWLLGFDELIATLPPPTTEKK